MITHITLDCLKPGQSGTVCGLCGNTAMKTRMQDLGIVVGTKVGCLMISPFGDPVAYRIRGTVIALRREDARGILIRPYDALGAEERAPWD